MFKIYESYSLWEKLGLDNIIIDLDKENVLNRMDNHLL